MSKFADRDCFNKWCEDNREAHNEVWLKRCADAKEIFPFCHKPLFLAVVYCTEFGVDINKSRIAERVIAA